MSQILKFISAIKIIHKPSQYKFQKLNYCKRSHSTSSMKTECEDAVNIRHKFHEESEGAMNNQIYMELQASYTYFCMSTCLSRPDVALLGYAQFFAAAGAEERKHAQQLAAFVNMRGGTVKLQDLPAPNQGPFHDPVHALQQSIILERTVLESLQELHKIASTHGDVHLIDFLETNFIPEGYEGIRQLAEMLTRVQRAGPGVGTILLDLDLLNNLPEMHSPPDNNSKILS